MKRYYSILLVCLVLLIAIGGCSKFDNKLVDPNYPAPGTADVDLYLNYVQLGFSDFYANTGLQTAEPGLSEDGEDLTRMETMASRTYLSALIQLHLMVCGETRIKMFLRMQMQCCRWH